MALVPKGLQKRETACWGRNVVEPNIPQSTIASNYSFVRLHIQTNTIPKLVNTSRLFYFFYFYYVIIKEKMDLNILQ